MQNIVLAIHVIIAVLLIITVLMQRSEGGGLGIGGNSGGNAKAASQGGLDGLQKLTWGLGIAFFITSLTLTILATRSLDTSLLDSLDGLDAGTAIESSETPAAPADEPVPPTDPNAIPADPTQN